MPAAALGWALRLEAYVVKVIMNFGFRKKPLQLVSTTFAFTIRREVESFDHDPGDASLA